jgi:glutamate-1-semialdehyde aminotransferase
MKNNEQGHLKYRKSLQLYAQAEKLFPYGTQLLSRNPRMAAFGEAPIYFDHGKDAHFWDVDGNEFIDCGMGIGPLILGYCYEPVDTAAKKQIDRGVIGTINNANEIDMAQAICEMVPCGEMVKFCKGGGEADAIAVRIARGYTGKDKVLFCGYHGWHDWYLAANLESDSSLDEHLRPGIIPKGVPSALVDTSVAFKYNDLDSLKNALEKNSGKVACIIMEAVRYNHPEKGFLEGVRQLADDHECVLIFDEVVTGFRMALGGAQEYYGVTPDLATFGKAIANGFPLAAVAGKEKIMSSQYDNFISSTYYSETVSLAAGIAVMNELRTKPVLETLDINGKQLTNGINALAKKHNLRIKVEGRFSQFHLSFDYGEKNGKTETLYMQEMIARGIYCTGGWYMCYTHTQQDIHDILAATDETFEILTKAITHDKVNDMLRVPVREVVFKRRLV